MQQMIPKKRGKTVQMAKRLRREMSPAEVFLWQQLRAQEIVKIRRDHPFGPYALDFYCAKAKLAIEVDGIVHDMGDHPQRDVARMRMSQPMVLKRCALLRVTC